MIDTNFLGLDFISERRRYVHCYLVLKVKQKEKDMHQIQKHVIQESTVVFFLRERERERENQMHILTI